MAIIGDEKEYKAVKEAFVAASKAMKIGYGLDESMELGPLTTQQGKDKVAEFMRAGVKSGAKLLLDGRKAKVKGYENGYYLSPTISKVFLPICI